MIRGITPVDAAFELMGLHQAQVLMRFIFLEMLAGKVIFAFGFISSIRSGMEKGNFKSLFVFLMMFFSLWFLFMMPRAKVADPVSAMERSGYHEITAVDILRKNGYGEVMVSPVVDVLSRLMDSLVTASVAVLDKGGGYFMSPFVLVKVSIVTSRIMAQGITDHELEQRTVCFYQDHFWPAMQRLGKRDPGFWPGHPQVMAAYKEEGRVAWQALQAALYQACDQQKIFEKMFERFYDGRMDQDAVVRSLLAREIALKPVLYTFMAYDAQADIRREEGSSGVFTDLVAEKIMGSLPFMQGGALFFLWSSLPAFFVVTLLFRITEPLIMFMGVLFSVKAWTLIWVLLDKVSLVCFGINETWGGVALWQSPAWNIWIVCLALVLPLMMTAGVVLITRRCR